MAEEEAADRDALRGPQKRPRKASNWYKTDDIYLKMTHLIPNVRLGAVLLSAKFITKVEVDLQSEPDVKPSSVPAAQMGDEFDELKREEILYYGDDVGKKGATSTAEEGDENK